MRCGFFFLVVGLAEWMGFNLSVKKISIGREGIMECSLEKMLNFARDTELPGVPP